MMSTYHNAFDEDLVQDLDRRFREAEEAAEFVVLPPGEYLADAVQGTFDTTRKGVPELKITFQIAKGDFVGQRFWLHLYLSEKALPITKRDLRKFEITDLAQIRDRWPATWRCRVKLTVQTSDAGNESNRAQLLEVLERLDPGPEPFAPTNGDPASVPALAKPPLAPDPFSEKDDTPF
jgi:hypothetical protein